VNNSIAVYEQWAFFVNARNKHQFVNMLAQHLQSCGCSVKQSESVGDVDTGVMSVAIELTQSGAPVIIYAGDTPIYLLCLYWQPTTAATVFRSDAKAKSGSVGKRLSSQGREPAENQQMALRSSPAGGGVAMLGLVHIFRTVYD